MWNSVSGPCSVLKESLTQCTGHSALRPLASEELDIRMRSG